MTKHAVNTEALQAVIDYLQQLDAPYPVINKLVTDLAKDAVQVDLKYPDPVTTEPQNPVDNKTE